MFSTLKNYIVLQKSNHAIYVFAVKKIHCYFVKRFRHMRYFAHQAKKMSFQPEVFLIKIKYGHDAL